MKEEHLEQHDISLDVIAIEAIAHEELAAIGPTIREKLLHRLHSGHSPHGALPHPLALLIGATIGERVRAYLASEAFPRENIFEACMVYRFHLRTILHEWFCTVIGTNVKKARIDMLADISLECAMQEILPRETLVGSPHTYE